jgi:hypothetical protein
MRGRESLESVDITDAYLAAWLLMNGCTLVERRYIPHVGPLSCLMIFSGPRIHELEEEYFGKRARVDLWEFRVASNRINEHIHEAKRSYEQARGGEAAEGGTP